MTVTLTPIGVVHGGGNYPQQAPRQGVWGGNTGTIELFPRCNYESALDDLSGFERIWVLFLFDRNTGWKPKVMPPWGSVRKRGVFATRSPHRPNPLGLSAVELTRVEGLTLHIRNFDMLDGTPILDIKPYIPEADAFPASRTGWRAEAPEPRLLELLPEAENACSQLLALGGPDLRDVARLQLTLHDLDPRRQRLEWSDDGSGVLAFRTWRLRFEQRGNTIRLLGIASGYSADEIASSDDPYCDKELHRKFNALARRA